MKNENYQPLLGSVGAIDNSLWLRRITKHNPWTFFCTARHLLAGQPQQLEANNFSPMTLVIVLSTYKE